MKYVTADYWYDRGPLLPHLSVDGERMKPTGLLDADGNELYRTQPPIGFGRDEEWDD